VQLQASPVLGAPTLPFLLLDYFSIHQDAQRSFVRAGIPQEWQTIASLPDNAGVTACAALVALLPIELHAESGAMHRVSAQVGPGGETYLLDERSLESLHYVRTQAGIVFTSLAGSANGLLGCLFQAAPLLPDFELGTFETNEALPAEVTWPGWKRILHGVARCVVAVAPIQVRLRVQSAAGILVIASERHRAVRRIERLVGRGKLVVDSLGIRQIELTDANGRRTAAFSRGALEATQQPGLSIAQHL